MTNKKLKLKEVLDIALLADAVMKNPSLKFKADADMAILSHHCKRVIECEIGPEMKKLDQAEKPITQEIKSPFQQKIDEMIEAKADEEEVQKESQRANANILRLVAKDSRLEVINQNRELLWEREFDEELPTVEIENMEYSERFSDEPVEASFMNGKIKIRGYDALRALIARKVVYISK